MNNPIGAMLIAMAMAFTSVGFAAESQAKQATDVAQKAPSFLFVLQAAKGTA